jgi:DNA-directed RNA polymerase specialized sigma24 family protein
MNDDNKYIQQLLAEARSGSRESTRLLATILRKRLYAFVLRTTLSRETTERILQETLLTVLRQGPSHQNGHAIWPWVFGVAWSRIQANPGRYRRMPGNPTSAACSTTA